MSHFFVLLYQKFFKCAYFLMVIVFVLLVDFDSGRRPFHEIDSEVFKILVKRLIGIDDDGFSVFDDKNISGNENLKVRPGSVFADFI